MKTTKQKQEGFTLVELAIVLVIIGLIVGGVLVGQDLIKAATIRATVTDVEKFNAAATTFRGKYSGYPGDIVSTKATEFGLDANSGRTGAVGLGDGNGLVEGGSDVLTTNLGGETANFWLDLSTVGLIPANTRAYAASATIGAGGAALTNADLGGGYLPRSKLRDSALFTVFSSAGRNFFGLGKLSTSSAAGLLVDASAVTPLEARGIDEKLDDGQPLTGVVTAISAFTTTGGTLDTAAGASGCVVTAGYNSTTDALLNAIACSLSIRASF